MQLRHSQNIRRFSFSLKHGTEHDTFLNKMSYFRDDTNADEEFL